MATIDIDGIGKVTIPKGSEWATEETLKNLVDALTGKNPNSKVAKAEKDKATQTSNAGKEVKMFGKTLFKMTPALSALETGFSMLGRTITGATGLVKSIAQADGSFSSLGGVVDFAADRISNTFGRLPIIGGFIDASAQATAELTKLRLAMMDLQKEAFQTLANSGLKLSNDLGQTLSTVLKANISIDQFNRLVSQNNDGLRIFRGNINNAAVEFSANLERLTSTDSEVGMGLRLLGLGSNEIAEEFAEFIQSQRNNNRLLSMDSNELNKQMMTRIKNERIIAELTGKSVEEQRRDQMALAADAAYQAALLSFPPEVRDNLDNLIGGLDATTARLVKQILGFGGAIDDETAMLISGIPGLQNILTKGINDIASGSKESSDVIADVFNTINSIDLSAFAKLGMLDTKFATVFGEVFLLSQRSKGQLENFNAAMGTTYDDIGDAQKAFNDQYEAQIELAKSLTGKDKAEVEKRLSEMEVNGVKLDQKTIEIIMQSAQVEDAVGNMQSRIFDLSTEFSGLTGIVASTTEMFDKLLSAAGLKKSDLKDSDAIIEDIQSSYMGGAAGGGSVGSGLYLVGERGPELLKLSQGAMGRVYPHGVTKNMLAGKAAGGMNIFGGSGLDNVFGALQSFGESMAPGLEGMVGSMGGDMASIMNNGSMGSLMSDSISAMFSANPEEAMAAATGKFEQTNQGALGNMVSKGQSMAQQMEGNPEIQNLVKTMEGFTGEAQGKLQEKSNITQEMVLNESKQTNKLLKDFLTQLKTTNGFF